MKKIAYLTIIITLTNTSINYGLGWSDLTKKLSSVDHQLGNLTENWFKEKNYKKIIQDPVTKIIHDSAKNKEQQIDAAIFQINEELSVLNNLNSTDIEDKENKKKTLEQDKKVFHNITTIPNIYLQYYYGERKYTDGKHDLHEEFDKIYDILKENKWTIMELEDQFYAKYPIRHFPEKSASDIDQLRSMLKRDEKIKENLSNTLTSAEKYQELLSQSE